MLESILPALQGVVTSVKAMASFDAFLKGRKGDIRTLVEELKENSRLCFHVVDDDVNPALVIARFSTVEYDRLNKTGFNFNALKREKIRAFPGIKGTNLSSWPGKSTSDLVQNIYDKIKTLRSVNEFAPENPHLRRRIINIHKRVLLLLRHTKS
jgi:hypothetical protein